MKKDLWDFDPYQFDGVDFLKETPRGALHVDMGMGKTAMTLTALQQLIAEGEVKRALVVAPLRVARKGWPDEIREWDHLKKLSAVMCTGDATSRLQGLRTEANIHLLNFNNLPWLQKLFYKVEFIDTGKIGRNGKPVKGHKKVTQLRPVPWDCIVIDESTVMQNPQGSWYNAMRYLQRNVPRLWELTGDSIPNGYMGLWSQMFLLDQGERLGPTITGYRKEFFDYNFNSSKYDIQETGIPRIQKAISDITFTLREEDHLDLPPYPEPELLRCQLSTDERKKYREMQRQYVMELDGEEITAVNAGVVWGKLLQLANGTVWVDENKWLPFHDHKIRKLETFLQRERGPNLIVYTYRPDLERIQKLLTRMGRTWRLLKDEQDEDDWNDDKITDLILHPKSGGHGLNLHYGSGEMIIHYGMTPSADLYRQTNARLYGGRRRLKKPNGRIAHIVTDETQDLVAMNLVSTKVRNSDGMKAAMVKLRQELLG